MADIRNLMVETTSPTGRTDMAGIAVSVRGEWLQGATWKTQTWNGVMVKVPGPFCVEFPPDHYPPSDVIAAILADNGRLLPYAIRGLHSDPLQALHIYSRARLMGYVAG